MSRRLSLATLAQVPPAVRTPRYDPAGLGVGILHLGPGAFHRAHQAMFTEDAIEAEGGDWGILGVALRRPETPDLLNAQDGLYTVELRGDEVQHRVIGALREGATARVEPRRVLDAFSSPRTNIVTLTVTEKGYALDGAGDLDFAHPDVALDLARPDIPFSTVGWLAAGLAERRTTGGGPLTVISCDNLNQNGRKLQAAVLAFASVADPTLVSWIEDNVAFPSTMVDSITPASTPELLERVEAAIDLTDLACVQREAFTQWVIEDAFAGPRPAWEAAGAELVSDVEAFEALKLHILNAAHSALAYLGLPRGHALVRQAIADGPLAAFLDAMILEEVAPALPLLAVDNYWGQVRERFANPNIDHALAQIAQDGSLKLAQRIFPIMAANVREGRPAGRLAQVVAAWLERGAQGALIDPQAVRLQVWGAAGRDISAALDDPALFPEAFRLDENLRRLMVEA